MNPHAPDECCPRFNPEPWDNKVITWQDKRFVQDRVSSFFHLPMNFDVVLKRNDSAIRAADAYTESRIVLTDENSAWGADVYFEVSKDIQNAKMVSLSGTFLCKVFEGSYREIGIWIEEMKAYVAAKGKHLRKMYFYYTTCPECAKKYGKNYVVILAEIDAG
jgi:hypothetical protein